MYELYQLLVPSTPYLVKKVRLTSNLFLAVSLDRF